MGVSLGHNTEVAVLLGDGHIEGFNRIFIAH